VQVPLSSRLTPGQEPVLEVRMHPEVCGLRERGACASDVVCVARVVDGVGCEQEEVPVMVV